MYWMLYPDTQIFIYSLDTVPYSKYQPSVSGMYTLLNINKSAMEKFSCVKGFEYPPQCGDMKTFEDPWSFCWFSMWTRLM